MSVKCILFMSTNFKNYFKFYIELRELKLKETTIYYNVSYTKLCEHFRSGPCSIANTRKYYWF